jgi:hypothetical protein
MSPVRAPFAAQTPGTIAHVTLDGISARFALEGICKSMVVEIRVVLIHSCDVRLFFHTQVCISINTPFLYRDFCAVRLWEFIWGVSSHWGRMRKGAGKVHIPSYICDYEFIVWGGRMPLIIMEKRLGCCSVLLWDLVLYLKNRLF